MDGLVTHLVVEFQKEVDCFGEGHIMMLLHKGDGVAPFALVVVIVPVIVFYDDMLCFFEDTPIFPSGDGISERFRKGCHIRAFYNLHLPIGESVIVHGFASSACS